MKTFWRVLETLAVVTLVLVWPLGAFAQIGKITSPGGYGTSPTFGGTVTFGSTTTAGTATTLINDTITGSSTTSNFLNITGTFPATLSATTTGVNIALTGDDDNSAQNGLQVSLSSSGANPQNRITVNSLLTGTFINSDALAVYGKNTATSTGNGFTVGARGEANGNAAGRWAGIVGYATSGNGNATATIGGYFAGVGSTLATTTSNYGVVSGAQSSGTNGIGGLFFLNATSGFGISATAPSSLITATGKAALVADNGAVAANIFEARDNGAATSTTAASANVTILDGAQMRLGNMALTGSTMTPTIVSEARTVTHSYAWTNAMVAALAGSAGDINVATLPAKTQINNAYVIIDTPDTSANALTVSCGDAIAGTPFINYIVASDAKAAANTVYGDAVAERGTSIDTEFYYLPSYTATTLVTCHFIKTTTALSTVTGSTGRLILTTTLLP